MTHLRLISVFLILIFGVTAFAQTPAIHLDYPHGRFREESAPKFFKWSIDGKITSVTLKIYSTNEAGKTKLLRRFDLTPSIDSLTLPDGALSVGQYSWNITVFDETSPQPVASETTTFEVKTIEAYDLRTSRISIFAGASRGSYVSSDPIYDISFDTTPNVYGLAVGGKQGTNLWDASITSSDFILKGAVFRTFDVGGTFAFPLNRDDNRITVHAGPTLHAFLYPQVRTDSSLNLATKNLTTGSLGLQIIAQTRLDQSLELYAKAGFDAALLASQPLNYGSSFGSYGAHVGLLFGQFWPLGLGADIGYDASNISTKDSSDDVTVKQNRLSLELSASYAL